MAATSFGVRLLIVFLFCPCYDQRHANFASAAPPSAKQTSGHSIAAVPDGRPGGVVNTTVTVKEEPVPLPPAVFFRRAPPPLWSKSKASWSSLIGFSSSTLPKYKGGGGGGTAAGSDVMPQDTSRRERRRRVDNGSSPTGIDGNPASSTSVSTPPVASSNRSAIEPPPLSREEQRGARRRLGKSGGASNSKARKPLCSYHRAATASSLHGPRVECSGVVVVVAAGSALLVLLCSLTVTGVVLLRCVHRKRREEIAGAVADREDDDDMDRHALIRPSLVVLRAAGPRRYSYSTLTAATGNFAERKRIGRGGFGSVYRGFLEDQDRHVAVKSFSAAGSPEQGRREFEAEVEVLSQLRHRNVVQLVGWSDGREGIFLVYELVPGGSLDKHLYDPQRLMSWPERYKIALDLGAALRYLHTEFEQCVVHGDIKPSNVMLDSSGNVKLGDFGLARLVDHGAEPRTTQVVAGTLGYIDPEFISDRRRGTESDVYSFGIVLLEIACGGRPTASGQPKKEASSMLLNRVRRSYAQNAVLDAADGRLGGAFDEEQMERVLVTGLWCADRDRSQRPSIAQAMDVLRSASSELPVLPAVALHGDRGRGEIRVLEERAYGDLSTDDDGDVSTISSGSTAYLSLEDSKYQDAVPRTNDT